MFYHLCTSTLGKLCRDFTKRSTEAKKQLIKNREAKKDTQWFVFIWSEMYITYHNSASEDTQNTCSKAKIRETDCCLNVIMFFKLNYTFLPLPNKEHTFASNSNSTIWGLFPIIPLRRYLFLQWDMISIIFLHWILIEKNKIKRAIAFLSHIWYMHDRK